MNMINLLQQKNKNVQLLCQIQATIKIKHLLEQKLRPLKNI
jgi:hypothetical protein